MAEMVKYEFAYIAQETTDFWNLPDDSTVKNCRMFTLSMFRVGEATYCCSLTPSTYVDDIENLFFNRDGSPLTDAQWEEIDNEYLQHEALDHSYINYVNPDVIGSNPFVGDTYWNEYDPDDYDDADAMREEAWEDAREEMQANCSSYEPSLSGVIPDPMEFAA